MGIPYCEIIERMKLQGKLKNDSAVAKIFGITPQALSNYKKRNAIPSKMVIKFAQIYNISVDWLITGERLIYKTSKAEACHEKKNEFNGLSSQEIEYLGKVIKIFRGQSEGPIINAMKHVIDSLYESVLMSEITESVIKDKNTL